MDRITCAERAAQDLLARTPSWLWDGRPPIPVEAIAEELFGLRIEERDDLREHGDDGLAEISGVLLIERRLLLVNRLEAARAPGRRRFTIAHELGHLVLHRGMAPVEADDERWIDFEEEANVFAAGLLMPRPLVDSTALSAPRLATTFHVSQEAAERRLRLIRMGLRVCVR